MNVSVSPRLTRAAEGLPRRRFTVAEVEAMVEAGIMDEDERVELIGGELVPMSPKGNRHEVVKIAAAATLVPRRAREIEAGAGNNVSARRRTPIWSPTSSSTPARWAAGLTGPNVLLVVEIADSSQRYDMGRKAKLYASFGVRELWVIDAVKLTARVFRSPSATGYRETRDFAAPKGWSPHSRPRSSRWRSSELNSLGSTR